MANFITDLPLKLVPEDTAIIKHAEITTKDKLIIVKQTLAYIDTSLEEASLTCSFSSIKEFIKKPFLINKFQILQFFNYFYVSSQNLELQ